MRIRGAYICPQNRSATTLSTNRIVYIAIPLFQEKLVRFRKNAVRFQENIVRFRGNKVRFQENITQLDGLLEKCVRK